MDDILASIRRILNEDEAAGAAPQAAPTPAAGPVTPAAAPVQAVPPEPEPIDLTEAMLVQPVEPSPAGEHPVPAVIPPPDSLVAPTVAAAATAAVGQLLRAVAQERASPVHRGGPSIEDVVREELRPLLKAWLDQHLPPIVERAVRAEIERVVGRALP
jgi:cell pole-organizing protein PopZ